MTSAFGRPVRGWTRQLRTVVALTGIVSLMVTALVGLPGTASAARERGTLAGTARYEDGRPVAAGTVCAVLRRDVDPPVKCTSIESGEFEFRIEPGTYALRISPPGSQFIWEYYLNQTWILGARMFTVTADSQRRDIDFVVTATPKLSGRVTVPSGATLGPSQVCVFRDSFAPTRYACRDVTSNRYSISVLPGNYLIGVFPNREFGAVYHRDADTIADASTVTAEPGIDQTIDFALRRQGQVSGRVSDTEQRPLADIRACLQPPDPDQDRERTAAAADADADTDTDPKLCTRTDADGTYRIGGIPAGVYELHFNDRRLQHYAAYYRDPDAAGDRRRLVVRHEEVLADRDVTLIPLREVSGRVLDEFGNPQAASVCWLAHRNSRPACVPADSGGHYRLLPLRPRFKLMARSWAPTYSDQFWPAEREFSAATWISAPLAGAPFHLSLPPVDGVLASHGTVSGTVELDGAPVGAVLHFNRRGPSVRGASVEADGAGRYHTPYLPPGDYNVFGQTVVPGRPQAAQPKISGETTVTAGQTTTLNLDASGPKFPPAPTWLTADAVGPSWVALRWSPATPADQITSFWVERGNQVDCTVKAPVSTCTVRGLAADTEYRFGVRSARDSRLSEPRELTVRTAPRQPDPVVVTPAATTTVTGWPKRRSVRGSNVRIRVRVAPGSIRPVVLQRRVRAKSPNRPAVFRTIVQRSTKQSTVMLTLPVRRDTPLHYRLMVPALTSAKAYTSPVATLRRLPKKMPPKKPGARQ